jgi:hypothetical protein
MKAPLERWLICLSWVSRFGENSMGRWENLESRGVLGLELLVAAAKRDGC